MWQRAATRFNRLMDAAPSAPPVVAVVVTHDAGPWLEDALAALGEQDYPNLSVLVVDAASTEDPTPRVASVLPSAYVRRLSDNPGFGPAANEVLQVVEGASHFLFCHDDVAPAPDAVRALVEEAFRSNAGIVAPKLVEWSEPERLLQVGLSADKSGAPSSTVERGELDQEQHDAVRDVFVAPGGCTLVRADLFASLGGFDPEISLYGEDLDLSWRAQVAGARVIVAPAARVRHIEALSSGQGPVAEAEAKDLRAFVRPLQLRHRLRAVLKNYGLFHLIRVVPQIVLLNIVEVLYGLVLGRRRTSADIIGAWRWNLQRPRFASLRAARRANHKHRTLHDGEVRRLQARGSARMTAFIRGQLGVEERARLAALAGRDVGASLRALRTPIAVWSVIGLVLLMGSRTLLNGPIPAVGELAPFPDRVLDVLRPFLSGWRDTGLGSESPAPAAFALLSLGGTLLLGGMGLLQKLLVLGMVPLGAVGTYRLVRPLGSTRVRLAATVVYLAIPLPYNALARGRWSALLFFGAAPWILARLAAATGLEPFGGTRPATGLLPVARLGLIVALLAAFVPSAPLLTLLLAAALVVGSLLAGGAGRAVQALSAALGAAVVAIVLLFPWSLDFVLPGTQWASVTSAGTQALDAGRLLRFETGPLGAAPLGWAFLLVAALPLLIGGGWRFTWAARLWSVAIVFWAVTWTAGEGWLPLTLPSPEVMLVPAALALAVTAALGVAAFEVDLPAYSLGWRQVASVAAAAAAALGAVPVLGASVNGRWNLPSTPATELVTWMDQHRQEGAFRVLWVGDPEAIPVDGWRLADGTAYATSRNGNPDVTDRWPGADPGASGLLADALDVARAGGTTRLGHLLGPTAVRYIVVPLRAAPSADRLLPPHPDVLPALAAQLDLKRVDTDPAIVVYENAAWAPARALVPDGADVTATDPVRVELGGSKPVLAQSNSGPVPEPGTVLVSEASSPRWRLRVAGADADRRRAFGWANAFDVTQAGNATLRYRTSPLRWLAIAIEAALWVGLLRMLLMRRGRHS
jgi:GT2 family glycosyltransferase